MEKIANRYLVLVVILLVTTWLSNWLSYDRFDGAEAADIAVSKIPRTIGKWRGKDFPLDPEIYNILETRSIIHRRYVYNGRSVFLSLVYYADTKVDFHAPEACLSGNSIQLEKSVANLNLRYDKRKITIPVNQLIREKGGQKELIYYFFKAGNFLGKNYIALRVHLAINKLSSKRSGALIRISTPMKNVNTEQPSAILSDFAQQLYPYIMKNL